VRNLCTRRNIKWSSPFSRGSEPVRNLEDAVSGLAEQPRGPAASHGEEANVVAAFT
jgi:hypothetical protein